MKVKKILSVILMGVMTAGLLAGCGSETSGQDSAEDTSQETADVQTQEDTTGQDQDNTAGQEDAAGQEEAQDSAGTTTGTDSTASGNVLVVYYSATGNTEEVANTIAEATGGDLFELESVEPYTGEELDWTNSDSRVSQEHENEDQRNVELVSSTVDNWDSYDMVFIGYPIWWGIAAWPVDTFVEANDFTGKTVIPFCTSSSSGIGDSGNLLADLAGTGDWQDGERFRSGADEADVQEWVNGLGL
ncbi:MAG TPA: flavodoxin [Candidatus Pullilachnospira intestinigallinarum]|nr:flavodoxin [Candidatus Pullilachnospira intestinigallinarum]